MKKIIYTGLVLFLFSALSAFADTYPPEGWTDDILEAIAESERTGKEVLLNFTGSDWCVWCDKLKKEVFSTDEFKDYAEENLILVFLDFPNGIPQSDEQKKQNEVMAQIFGVQGFPTLWLMDSEQVPLMKTGYRDGGAAAYIQHLEDDRPSLDEATKEEYKELIRSTIKEHIGSW
ncbi:MAG: thioredoxin family protein [Spirochaetales bacterium]|nr:thioredoxin family protein [Spirochaetales bacterium]